MIDGVLNYDEDKQIADDLLFFKLSKVMFIITDDDEMKNRQLRDKIGIIQNYIDFKLLGIP